jgi:hypothetical protein
MFVAQGPPPDPESIRAVALLIAAGAVIFWRIAIRLAIIGAIVLVLLGAVAIANGLH